jgi:C4-dicarboxylate-specific signal transduction histidine kinase
MSSNDSLYDDLSRLNNELVNLQRELAKKNAELQKAHDGLENCVVERTADLRAANERLRNEIEERQRAEEESRRLRSELAHLNRVGVMGALTAAIAHETNQPLAAILSNAQAALRFLDREPPDLAEVREALEDIVADDKRAGDVINRIRKMAKREDSHRELYDLNGLIVDLLNLVHGEITLRKATMTTDLDTGVGKIHGDPVQVQQVILNLVMNALDAMSEQPEDNRRMVLSTELENGEGVVVSVVDSGPGVDPEILETMFESFFTTKSHGMGLGLALCRTFVEAQGGHVKAENLPEGGAKFSFWLPLRREV